MAVRPPPLAASAHHPEAPQKAMSRDLLEDAAEWRITHIVFAFDKIIHLADKIVTCGEPAHVAS